MKNVILLTILFTTACTLKEPTTAPPEPFEDNILSSSVDSRCERLTIRRCSDKGRVIVDTIVKPPTLPATPTTSGPMLPMVIDSILESARNAPVTRTLRPL